MNTDKREVRRKLRILRHAEETGQRGVCCMRFRGRVRLWRISGVGPNFMNIDIQIGALQAAEPEHEGSTQLNLCHPRERFMRHDAQLKNSAPTLIDMHFCSVRKKFGRRYHSSEGHRSLWTYPK